MRARQLPIFVGILVLAALALTACGAPGPEGPPGPAGPQGEPGPAAAAADLTCTECHNDTTLIVSKEAQFRERSVHGSGEAFIRGETTSCAGCHGTEGAKARINAGLPPHDPSVEGVTNVSPFDCRTCHNIHTTYTKQDFSLTGNGQPVALEYSDGTFDGGDGNLCAECHQVRNPLPAVADGKVSITSARFGPHYGIPAPMLMGVGGFGVSGKASSHYSAVEDTCVGCHMGAERDHTYAADVSRCVACHADAADFDIGGVQTEVAAMLEELHTIFVAKKLLNPETDLWGLWEGGKFAVPSADAPLVVTEAMAQAMWNYKFVVYDLSNGVHNATYTKALLEAALEAVK